MNDVNRERSAHAYHEAGHAIGHVILDLPFRSVLVDPENGRSAVQSAQIFGFEGYDLMPPTVEASINGDVYIRSELLPIWHKDMIVRLMGPVAQYYFANGVLPPGNRIKGFYGQALDYKMVERYSFAIARHAGHTGDAVYSAANAIEVEALDSARNLVTEWWSKIDVVARELERVGGLSADDVRRLVRGPDCTGPVGG